jgi:Abnormal spindle-like microcephaly-assoc'd, ASPM-SPD-2-Hydin
MEAILFLQLRLSMPAVLIALLLLATPMARAKSMASPASVNFGVQTVGTQSTSVEVTFDNHTGNAIRIASVSSSASQFSYSGPSLPVTLRPGQILSGSVRFEPTAAQAYTGTLVFTRVNGLTAKIALLGSGNAAQSSTVRGQLSMTPSSISFGNVSVGKSGSNTIAFSNSGTATVTVSNVSIDGAGLNASGVSNGIVLSPGQSATMAVTFAPAGTGSISGSVTVTSNATDSTTSVPVSGTGVQAAPLSTALAWNAGASNDVVGYDVYRGSVSGGPYAILTNTPIVTTSYTDNSVQSGQTYYYAVTAVDGAGVQSAYSNIASASIP